MLMTRLCKGFANSAASFGFSSNGCFLAKYKVIVIVAVVHERGPAATSGLLLTKLPWLRQPPPPVFRWKLLHTLSTYFPPRLLLLGGDE